MSVDTISENNKSVRLSSFNVDVRSKLAKFDTDNQGELNINDLTHAVITLQKQSNNYKRLLYIILPIMLVMIASIFGTTILAINLTKDIKTNSSGSLVNAISGQVVSTSQAIDYRIFNEWLNSGDTNALREIHALELENMILAEFEELGFNALIFNSEQISNFHVPENPLDGKGIFEAN
jgi:hypothetical protein